MDKIGIITVLFKSDNVLPDFIKCMNKQTYKDYEILFIENDVDNTFCEKYLNENATFSFFFIRNIKNVGVAAANNQGIDYFNKKPGFTYTLFLNNDIEVADDFLVRQIQLFNKYPQMGAIAPKMFYYNTDGKIWYAGGTLSYLKEGARHYGHNKADILVGKEVFKVSYAPTCSLMIKTELLKNSGIRMWEQLFVYYDDYVFCKEIKKKNIILYYTPTIHLQHKISSSTGGSASEFSRYYSTRNWAYLVRVYKNLTGLIIPFYMIFNLITGRKIENKAIIDSFKLT